MTKVEFFDRDDRISGFSVSGHSGYDENGQDIVCAAVSALAQTALLGLTIHLKRDVSYDMEEGRLSVQLNTKPDAQTDAVLETMILGLLEIEKLHAEYITISQTRR